MHKLSTLISTCLILLLPNSSMANQNIEPLNLGVVPYMSVRLLIEKYEPARKFLETSIGKPVKIFSANGFKQFYQNTERGDFDLVLAPAHIARLLQKEHNYTPLVYFSTQAHALLVTNSTSSLQKSNELSDKIIAIPDQLALASIVCMTYLRNNGLVPGKNFKVLDVPSFPSAIMSVQQGDADAACTASAPLSQMPKEVQNATRILGDAGAFPNLIILASPKSSQNDSILLKRTLLKLNDDTSLGKPFITSLGFGPLIAITDATMNDLDRFLEVTRQFLQ